MFVKIIDMSAFKNRIGEKYITNEGYEIEIVQYFGVYNVTLTFQSGVILYNKNMSQIISGKIKNPHHKSVSGVGYFGIGKYNVKNNKNAYIIWKSLIQRCCNSKTQENHPTYKDVTVCEEWHNFQNFAEWFDENYIDGFHLDKDILVKGNKVYSPETCCFVPPEINGLFTKNDNNRGNLPIGVHIRKDYGYFIASINRYNKKVTLGSYLTIEEAFQAYKTAKEQHIKEIADKYKNQISEKVYQVLINYKVEITD